MSKSLSIIIPFYHKLDEFKMVFPLNKPMITSNMEVILCIDEPDSAEQIIQFVKLHPDIRWKVLVNKIPHTWRSPTKSINVGLRNSTCDYILVVSPESKFVNNLPTKFLDNTSESVAVIGKLSKTLCEEFVEFGEEECIRRYNAQHTPEYYGSICFFKESAYKICGYDECMMKWGGDDDNFRARLKMIGTKFLKMTDTGVLHFTFADRQGVRKADYTDFTPEEIYSPKSAICPKCSEIWGKDFTELVYQN